jgi:hypothetical protein
MPSLQRKSRIAPSLEPLFYEVAPYLYFLAALLALSIDGYGTPLKLFASMLLAAAGTILGMRLFHRNMQS